MINFLNKGVIWDAQVQSSVHISADNIWTEGYFCHVKYI